MNDTTHMILGISFTALMAVGSMACALWNSRELWRKQAEEERRRAAILHTEVLSLREELARRSK